MIRYVAAFFIASILASSQASALSLTVRPDFTPIAIDSYGAAGDGVTDDTAAFLAWQADCGASKDRLCALNRGRYNITSQPPCFSKSVNLSGVGKMGSLLIRNYTGTANKGLLCFEGGDSTVNNYNENLGLILRDLAVIAGDNTSGGCGISLTATSTTSWNRATIDSVTVTTNDPDGNNFDCGLIADGSAMDTGAMGIRGLTVNNSDFFGANGYSEIYDSVIALNRIGGGTYPAGGSHAKSGFIHITGSATLESYYINWSTTNFAGMDIDNTITGRIDRATGPVNIGSNVTGVDF